MDRHLRVLAAEARVRFDRLTLALMLLCQFVQYVAANPFVVEVAVVLLMTRMYFAYHPRLLARAIDTAASNSNLY
jgi:hypothetical protein